MTTKLKRIRYNTMNSWNNSTAPAFNLKIHKVIPRELQDKVFEMLECENFYDNINFLISKFNSKHNYEWQAGFNGRSNGYLVLYTGGKKPNENHKDYSQSWTIFKSCKHIENNDVPENIMKSFEKLAKTIVKTVINNAKNCSVEKEEYIVTKTRKVIV